MKTDKNKKLLQAKLESSGLDLKDAEMLGMKYLSGVETKALAGGTDSCPSLYIPYYNPQSNEPMRFVPGYKPFFRIRYLGERLPTDEEGKPQRYRQGTKGVCAYFPRNQDWASILRDRSQRLFITEGELKAAKACKEGLPTIGLGGVDSFQSKKLFLDLLPELKEIDWIERLVYIVYDSDVGTNESMAEAVNRLGTRLADRGAIPFFLSLPDVPDLNKTGLDDYLVRNSIEQFHSEVMPTAMHLTAAEKVWEMNQRYIKISNPPGVYDKLTHQLLSFSDFTKINSAKIPVFHKLVVSKNDGRPRMSSDVKETGSEWMHSPVHLRADELVNLPEEPDMGVVTTATGREMRQYNSWRRWGCSPVKGDVTPFHTLFNFLTESLNKKQRQWLLQWFAYPLQNPKKNKMASAVVMYGETQGTGKSLLGTTMQKIYGFSGEVIRASILSTQFNAWLDGKLFIACDEMASDSRSSFYTFSETMKTYVTDPKILINQKNVKLYSVENRANFYFTTNKSNAVHLDRLDRRYFVCEVKGNPLPQEFYTEYGRWMESGGVEALFYYLRSEVSLSGFVHTAPPPQTAIKAEMTIATSSNEALWLRELIDDDSFMLRRNGVAFPCDLASVSELMEAYHNQSQIPPTRLGRGSFGSICREAGLRPVCDGIRLNTKRGKCIFFARANIDKWVKASRQDVISYIDSCIPKRSRAKRKF